MSATLATPSHGSTWGAISWPRLELGLVWLTFAVSSIVLFEPAPFDFMGLALVGIWLASGLAIPRSFSVPLILFGILALAGLVGAVISDTVVLSGRHILITIFLFILTFGIGSFVARDPDRALPVIMNGYTVAAVITVIAGIVGYFNLLDGTHDIFTERDRARGTFKDPNVFGPFLVVPIVYGFLRHMSGQVRIGGLQTWVTAFLCLGLLLSFSRGAWGNFLLAMVTATYLLFILTGSNSFRLKVLGLTACLIALALGGMVLALSFDSIADMMNIRGKLVQSYDTQQRFVGARIAVDAILANPFGIGAMSFLGLHDAEPHNVYLYSFLIGGWIGGFTYLFLIAYTLYVGFRSVLVPGPLRLFAILVFSAFLGAVAEGVIVDTDHWRHFYLLMACIWGLYAYGVTQRPGEPETAGGILQIRERKRLRLPFMHRKRLALGGPSRLAVTASAGVPEPKRDVQSMPRSGKVLTRARLARYRKAAATPLPQEPLPKTSGGFGRRNPAVLPPRPAFGRRAD